MSTVLIQLSDIHFSVNKSENPILDRLDALVAAIRENVAPNDYCIICIAGDIADWGKIEEYVLAAEFVERLHREISDHCKNKVSVVIVPGNHDLDFETEGCAEEIRETIIDKITPSNPPSEVMTTFCTQPQANYNSFIKSVCNDIDKFSVESFINSVTVDIPEAPLKIHMLNTSRFSKKIDITGQSWLPVDTIRTNLTTNSDGVINISLMHHPHSWNRAEIATDIKIVLEQSCDIILTGHIHEPDTYIKKRNLEQNLYIEGGVLQNHDNYSASSFNIVKICQDRETFTCITLQWTGEEYEPLTEPYKHKFFRLRQPLRKAFDLKESWANWLEEVGTDFRHTRKSELKLSDIFVYPDLQKLDVRKSCSATSIIRDKDVLGFIQEKKQVVLAGVEKSGKTSLAKQLFKDLRNAGYVPLIIRSDFKIPSSRSNVSEDRMMDAFDTVVKNVYEPEASRRFWQVKSSERVLIIDDFGRIKLPVGTRDELLRWADQYFSVLVVVCSPGLRLREILNRSEDDTLLWGFEHADILESDGETRHHLIKKWIAAGQDPYQTSSEEIHKMALRRSQVIGSVIAQGVIPSLPLFIFMMMQQLDGHGTVDANNGLYGSLYEIIIRDVIKEGTSNPAETEVFINYLTEFAYYVFDNRKKIINEEIFFEWHKDYCENFNRKINHIEALAHLEAVGVFRRQNGIVCFKYKYYYWYFSAKYLANNIHNPHYFEIIQVLSEELYFDDAANIMLFLCHFSKDPRILELIINKVKEHFKGASGYDLTQSPKVLPAAPMHFSQLALSGITSPHEEMIEVLRQQDDTSRPNGVSEFEQNDLLQDEGKEAISLFNEVTSATHLIRICGQIIRNFYGSMLGKDQVEIIKESYDLSLRMLSVTFGHMEMGKEEMAEKVFQILRQRNPAISGTQLDIDVKRSIRTTTLQITYGVVKHVSNSLGLADLAPSFDKVINLPGNTVSYDLLDVSTRLDYFEHFPEVQVLNIAGKIDRAEIGFEVLRVLVWEHFKLFRHDHKIMQRICSKLDIKYNVPTLLAAKDKRL